MPVSVPVMTLRSQKNQQQSAWVGSAKSEMRRATRPWQQGNALPGIPRLPARSGPPPSVTGAGEIPSPASARVNYKLKKDGGGAR